jgi:hypothetical protein
MEERSRESNSQAKTLLGALKDARPGVTNAELLAHLIVDNSHLKKFLATIPAANRRDAYNILRPHLNFVPKPFLLLTMGCKRG